ncbi:MAG: (Fe-S)-binding protein [Thermodesulfatator sp.]|nr:MAG: (Fe-S)-binding protein [Thermodesulfatator sp.]
MSGKWRKSLLFLGESLKRRGTPLSLSRWDREGWTRGLGLPRGGPVVLYTGLLYQMAPHAKVLLGRRERVQALEEVLPEGWLRALQARVDLAGFLSRALFPYRLHRLYWEPLRAVVRLLQAAGLRVGYLYEKDLYPGTLAYELGFFEAFLRQALRVRRVLEEAGVQVLITVDPHTTHLLRKVYPEVLPRGFKFEVRHYLEVLAESPLVKGGSGEEEVVLHEGCVWARGLGLSELPEEVLSSVGFAVKRPHYTGKTIYCCGGPVEGLFPEKARAVAQKRIAQLQAVGQKVATICPICHLNLSAVAPEDLTIRDLALWLKTKL